MPVTHLPAKKRKQHYVWKHYLKAWTNENDLIYCLRENKIFRPNITGIAQGRDFYRLKELTIREINLIKVAFVDDSPQDLRNLNADWIAIFNQVFEFRKKLEDHELLDEKWNEFVDVVANNLEEELHARIESDSIKYLASLLNEDTSFVGTDDYMDFLIFLCLQYLRTNKMRNNLLSGDAGVIENINLEAIWGVSKHILANSVAWNLYSRRDKMKLYLLKNATSIELITGDQPVINTFATDIPNNQLVDNLELYYPLSPKLAMILSDQLSEENREIIELSTKDVETYNKHIVKNSHSQIYSSSKGILEKLKRSSE